MSSFKKNILITGCRGQLGSELKVLSMNFEHLNFMFHDMDLDITNYDSLQAFFEANKVDFIVNCAAYTAVDKAESDKENAQKINVTGAENLAKIASEKNAKLIHTSTDYVFDGKSYIPYKENFRVSPTGVYAQTKLDGEIAVQKYNPEAIIIRTSWLYSIFGNNFAKTMLRLGKERDHLGVIFDQIGTPTNAADLAEAIVKVIEHQIDNAPKSGIYHYSNEGVCSWYDFALQIMEFAGIDCKIRPIETKDYPTPATRPPYSVLNKSKIKADFGIEIPHWKASLQAVVATLVYQ